MSNNRSQADPDASSKSRSNELLLRIISAAVGLPLLGLTIYLGFWTISAVSIVLAVIVGIETADMARSSRPVRIVSAATGALVVAVAIAVGAMVRSGNDVEQYQFIADLFAMVTALLGGFTVIALRYAVVEHIRRHSIFLYGAFASLCISLLPLIVLPDNGREVLTLVILTVFAADTVAYFVGRRLGRHKLAPNISPGKTVEGLIGGTIAAVAAFWLLTSWLGIVYSTTTILSIGVGIALVGVAGDLIESRVKRLSGVKDSGGIVPGHGGLLDRLDALAPNFVLIYGVARWLA